MENNEEKQALVKGVVDKLVEAFKQKGSIPEEELIVRLEMLDINSDQIEYAYDEIKNAGLKITASAAEEAQKPDAISKMLSDVSVDDAVKLYLRDIGRHALLTRSRRKNVRKPI